MGADNTNEVLHIQSQSVDELVDQEVLLMKVDVEGWEWSVFQGAKNLITKRLVKNVIMEYSPGVPER
jgi:FkbM family methyltransferase